MSSSTQKSSTEPADRQTEEPDKPDLTRDECFELLSNHRRRYTLHYLQQNGNQATLGELADQIAAWENDIPPEEVSYDQRKRVYTSLQQVHLPRMDDTGVVEFDDRDGLVEPGPAAEDLDVYLEVVQGHDIPWSVYYAALAVLNAVIVALATLGVPPFTVLPQRGLAVFVVTTFLVTAIAQVYITRTEMRLGQSQQPPNKNS
jgi:hypothetical protein